ncbi:MAG TPA: hypothetical protein VGY31_03410 [Terriglobia bacterium]|nr:hypothetical protein [Terriglobia bacterium]
MNYGYYEARKKFDADWNEKIRQLANEGVQHAQESVERMNNEPPSPATLELMRMDADAFDEAYVERWKHLL